MSGCVRTRRDFFSKRVLASFVKKPFGHVICSFARKVWQHQCDFKIVRAKDQRRGAEAGRLRRAGCFAPLTCNMTWRGSAFLWRDFRRENLCEAAFHFVHAGTVVFAKTKEISRCHADDGRNVLFWPLCDSPHEDNDFLPVKRLGRRFRSCPFFA